MINAVIVPYVANPCKNRLSRETLTMALADVPPRMVCNSIGVVDEKASVAVAVANTGTMPVDAPSTGGEPASPPTAAWKHSLLLHFDVTTEATAANPEASLVTGRIIVKVKMLRPVCDRMKQ